MATRLGILGGPKGRREDVLGSRLQLPKAQRLRPGQRPFHVLTRLLEVARAKVRISALQRRIDGEVCQTLHVRLAGDGCERRGERPSRLRSRRRHRDFGARPEIERPVRRARGRLRRLLCHACRPARITGNGETHSLEAQHLRDQPLVFQVLRHR